MGEVTLGCWSHLTPDDLRIEVACRLGPSYWERRDEVEDLLAPCRPSIEESGSQLVRLDTHAWNLAREHAERRKIAVGAVASDAVRAVLADAGSVS